MRGSPSWRSSLGLAEAGSGASGGAGRTRVDPPPHGVEVVAARVERLDPPGRADLGVGHRPVVVRPVGPRPRPGRRTARRRGPCSLAAPRGSPPGTRRSSAGVGSAKSGHNGTTPRSAPRAAADAGAATSPRPRPGCAPARCPRASSTSRHAYAAPSWVTGPSSSSSRRSSSSDSSSTAARSRRRRRVADRGEVDVVAVADPECQPAPGEPVEAGQLARDLPRPPPGQRHDQRPEPHPPGGQRDRRSARRSCPSPPAPSGSWSRWSQQKNPSQPAPSAARGELARACGRRSRRTWAR